MTNRLTKKDKNGKYYIVEEKICMGTEQINPIRTWIVGNENRGYGNPIDKLGKLEDLAEQIECPLEVREQAFEKGFYDQEGEHYFCEHYVPYLKSMHTRGITRGVEKHFKLKDYKITWFLKKDKSE